MADVTREGRELGDQETTPRWHRIAWPVIVIADAGLLAWGAMAAIAPEDLLGPGGAPILNAEYQSFVGGSWSSLSPRMTEFITIIYRMYGIFIVAFGLLAITIAVTAFRRGDSWAWWALLVGNTIAYPSAMVFDLTMNAIGPFELTEYIGLAVIYALLAATAPFLRGGRPGRLRGMPVSERSSRISSHSGAGSDG